MSEESMFGFLSRDWHQTPNPTFGRTYRTDPDAGATVLEVKNVKGFDLISVSGPDTEEEAKEATPKGFELNSFNPKGNALYRKMEKKDVN